MEPCPAPVAKRARVDPSATSLLHALPLSLATRMASFLRETFFMCLARTSRHNYAVVSRTPFAGVILLSTRQAICGSYPPNVRRCHLVRMEKLPLEPGITARWTVVVLTMECAGLDRPAPGSFPSGLGNLHLRYGFTQPLVAGILPESLRILYLEAFNQPLAPGVLPDGLEILDLGSAYNQPLASGALPQSLRKLYFGRVFNQPLTPGVLPKGIQMLSLGPNFGQPLERGSLSDELEDLHVWGNFDQPLTPGVLPESLRVLTLSRFNQPLVSGVFPSGLERLYFGHDFNQPLARGVLPAGLKSVWLGNHFNQPLEHGVLPDGLEALCFGFQFNQPLAPGVLPPGLGIVFLSARQRCLLPPSLPSHVTIRVW